VNWKLLGAAIFHAGKRHDTNIDLLTVEVAPDVGRRLAVPSGQLFGTFRTCCGSLPMSAFGG
jgi:hypothetical protein